MKSGKSDSPKEDNPPVKTERLSAALENYLEATLVLIREGKVARVRDIASYVGLSQSSVTAALKNLAKRELVNYDPYQYVTLTEEGERLAQDVLHRHEVLTDFLATILGVDPKHAETNACRMEHVIDKDVMTRLSEFAQFVQTCKRDGHDWIGQFLSNEWKTPTPHTSGDDHA